MQQRHVSRRVIIYLSYCSAMSTDEWAELGYLGGSSDIALYGYSTSTTQILLNSEYYTSTTRTDCVSYAVLAEVPRSRLTRYSPQYRYSTRWFDVGRDASRTPPSWVTGAIERDINRGHLIIVLGTSFDSSYSYEYRTVR